MARRWLLHGSCGNEEETSGASPAGPRANHWEGALRRAATAATVVAAVAFAGFAAQGADARTSRADEAGAVLATVGRSELPREAAGTLDLIAAGGPFPYRKDGVVFGNFERLLPPHRRGYYHEYTVPTPRARNRGAHRIVCGGPPRRTDDCYYSDDHYASFKRIVE